MRRLTITVDDELMGRIDALMAARGDGNRSEAIRDLARAGLRQAEAGTAPDQPCVAALVYTYDHGRRELPGRLTGAFHDHHGLSVSTLHVHLDEARCLEVSVLKGLSGEVRHLADHVIAERGLRHGQLVVMPWEAPVDVAPAPPAHAPIAGRRAAARAGAVPGADPRLLPTGPAGRRPAATRPSAGDRRPSQETQG